MVIFSQKGVRFLSGRVEIGKQLGRTIGFPTANLEVKTGLLPACGVYGVYVYRKKKKYCGVMNVGYRPTIQDGEHQTIEVHILDFHQNIYGETLVVEILFPIRDERKFSSIEVLKEQIQKDIIYAKNIFNKVMDYQVAQA